MRDYAIERGVKELRGHKEAEKARLARIEELEAYLAKTDWYVIRHADTGKSIPEDIKTKRQDARDEISDLFWEEA